MTNSEMVKDRRLTISITTAEDVEGIEKLRLLLEQRLQQRLSIAQVIKRLYKIALEEELLNSK